MRNRGSKKEWLGAVWLAIVTAATAAGALFLAGPMFMKGSHDYARYADVEPTGWMPASAIDFRDLDSIAGRDSRPLLSIRYSHEAPGELSLSLSSVLPDGSMRCDTLHIRLHDRYGYPEGKAGYGVNELLYPFGWPVDVADCRLLEIAPMREVKGICSVGLIIDDNVKNENHKPSAAEDTRI